MTFTRVSADDPNQISQVAQILAAADHLDDPDAFPVPESALAARVRYGRDLDPEEVYLYAPDSESDPVGFLSLEIPTRDNRHLIWSEITVHPQHRRRGHGSAMMAWLLDRAAELGRTTLWTGTASDGEAGHAYATRHGFHAADSNARRRQVLADVDHDQIAALAEKATAAAVDYRLERLLPPITDEILEQMVEVTSAINDAPMGELTYEDEKFDLQRMRDFESARTQAGLRSYRIVARHTATGVIGGHTEVTVDPVIPEYGIQHDTAVSRNHRRHRLGLLLKIDMMAWLAEAEPQLVQIETWNNVENRYMIDVNEAIGYRLSRTFVTFERNLGERSRS